MSILKSTSIYHFMNSIKNFIPFFFVLLYRNRIFSCQFPCSHNSLFAINPRRDKSRVNPEKPDVPLNKNDAFQKVQKRRVQEKR